MLHVIVQAAALTHVGFMIHATVLTELRLNTLYTSGGVAGQQGYVD
jgi:hypothetical protein